MKRIAIMARTALPTLALATALSACGHAPTPAASTTAPHWSYEASGSPEHWAEIAPACAGNVQSPVNLWSSTLQHGDRSHLKLDYGPAHFTVVNNGHTIQANPSDALDSGIELDGEHFTLKQFHVHTPSEHQVDGRSHDMELHLVHASASGKTAVVGVFFDVGQPNKALEELFTDIPEVLAKAGSSIALDARIDPNALLPAHGHVARYTGSLTTPPCTEGVLWNLELQPLQLSAAQLQALRSVYPHNNRPVQPFNGRQADETASP